MNRTQRLLLLLGVLAVAGGVLVVRWSRGRERQQAVTRAGELVEQGEPELALRTVRPFINAGRADGELLVIAAKAYRLLDEPAKALECLDVAASQGYVADVLDLERGLALAAVRRFAEAVPLLIGSPTKEAAVALASIHLQLFEMEKALDNLNTWKQLAPDDPSPYVVAGNVWARANEHETAVEQFRQALERRADLFEARLPLANSLAELGNIDEAVELLVACLEAQPRDPAASLRLATCEVERGNVAAARSLLEKLIEAHPHVVPALVELAKIELDDGNAAAAERLLAEAVSRDPTNDAAVYNLSLAASRLDRADEAAELMTRARELKESRRRLADAMDRVNADAADFDAFCEAGELLADLGQPQQAASLFSAVLARDPANARAREGIRRLN